MSLSNLGFTKVSAGKYTQGSHVLEIRTYGHHIRDFTILYYDTQTNEPLPVSSDIILSIYEDVITLVKKDKYEAYFIPGILKDRPADDLVCVSQGVWESESRDLRIEYILTDYTNRDWSACASTLDHKPKAYDTHDQIKMLIEIMDLDENSEHETNYRAMFIPS